MELLVIVVIAFLIGKAFGGKKKNRRNDWPDEPVDYMPRKKKGCFSRLLSFVLWGFILIVVAAFITSLGSESTQPNEPESAAVVSSPVEQSALTAAPVNVATAAPTVAPTVQPTSTPASQQDWVNAYASKIYGDSLLSIEWQDVDDDPMIVIQCVFEDNFTFDLRHAVFMGDAKNMFKTVAELGKEGKIKYSSCYIQGRTTFLDTYGNEFDGNAIEIRLKKDDLEKINWQNVNNDMLINLATPYTIHPVFRK